MQAASLVAATRSAIARPSVAGGVQRIVRLIVISLHLSDYRTWGCEMAIARRTITASFVLFAGSVPSHSQQLGLFSKALWFSSKCPAYELDEKRAMEVAVSVGLPDTPGSITMTKNEGLRSFAVPLIGQPEPEQLSDDECEFAYSMFGPDGSKISGLMKLKAHQK